MESLSSFPAHLYWKKKMVFISGDFPELSIIGFPPGFEPIKCLPMTPIVLRTGKPKWIASLKKPCNRTCASLVEFLPGFRCITNEFLKKSGKENIKSLFPNFQLFVYGGVNFEPYRHQLESLTGGKVASLETYPASEGFIAYQDQEDASKGLLLQCHSGIFMSLFRWRKYTTSTLPV